ncbi:zinc finger protein 235-like [Belonocnema kinseyi]|uniref:zinc finger protein 235-like n=1 Tax=Belonocnema kinseyi TaxID=2817044 RepID=UPI00143E0149|nr:zinc finger protein 235-like [Belonocnema kinseyi]
MENEEENAVVSGDVENIIIKLEPTEDFLGDEDPLQFEGNSEFSDEIKDEIKFREGFSSNETSLPSSEENQSDIIQTPFSLENYFSDNKSANVNELIAMKYLTCEDCKIVFSSERLLQAHLLTHIDIHRMGCNVCDKDLNMAEKFQLHVMAITRQSIYCCDLCRKSCAGVVRSKDQARPLGKTYACHDCEVQAIGKAKLPKSTFEFTTIKNGNCRIEFNLTGSRFNLDDECYHKCVHCAAFFAQASTLSRHVRERHNFLKNEENSAEKCVKGATQSEIKIHKFKCALCGLRFSRGLILAKHLREDHRSTDEKTKNVKLKVKTRGGSSAENLNPKRELRGNERRKGVTKFVCKFCRKEFSLQRSDESRPDVVKICKKCENQRIKKNLLHGKRRSKRIRLRNSR